MVVIGRPRSVVGPAIIRAAGSGLMGFGVRHFGMHLEAVPECSGSCSSFFQLLRRRAFGAGSLSADSDFSPSVAPRFVSFARPYHRFAPLRSPGVGRFPKGLDYFYRGVRAASSRWRWRDLPGSWATLAYMPRSSTPADRRPQATTGPAMWSSAI